MMSNQLWVTEDVGHTQEGLTIFQHYFN